VYAADARLFAMFAMAKFLFGIFSLDRVKTMGTREKINAI